MNMSLQKEIVVFSDDDYLLDKLHGDTFASRTSVGHEIKYHLSRKFDAVDELMGADVVVYDLDLVRNNQSQAAEDIRFLAQRAEATPLILAGEQDAVDQTLSSEEIGSLVTRSITKPVNRTGLEMALEAVMPKYTSVNDEQAVDRDSKRWLLLVAGVVAICFAKLISTSLISPADGRSISQAEVIPYDLPSAELVTETSQEDSFSMVADLLGLASVATTEGRLAFPANDNALYYYNKILRVDKYHIGAYEGQQQILQTLRGSVPGLLFANKLDEARRTVDILVAAEPFREDNQWFTNAVAKAEQAAGNEQRDSAIAGEQATQVTKLKLESLRPDQAAKSPEVKQQKILAPKQQASLAPIAVTPPAPRVNVTKAVEQRSRRMVAKAATIEPPVVIKRIEPIYPRSAIQRDIEGWVEIGYEVSEKGDPVNLRVVNAQPAKVFDKAGMKAIKSWKFTPARNARTGQIVVSKSNTVTFQFNFDT